MIAFPVEVVVGAGGFSQPFRRPRRRESNPRPSFYVGYLLGQLLKTRIVATTWDGRQLWTTPQMMKLSNLPATTGVALFSSWARRRPAAGVVELNTDFKVLSVLKGTPLRPTLVLRHYRQDTDRLPGPVLNAPLGLDFSRGPTTVYLLFLKRESDGFYAPTSAQVFPELSILALPKGPLTVFPR
jgi:hypothetical protein